MAAWCIWGPKVKIDYLILDAKLLLINVNYVEFFLFLEILQTEKIWQNFSYLLYGKLIIVNKKVVLVVDLDEN